jgi:hypothetical protein
VVTGLGGVQPQQTESQDKTSKIARFSFTSLLNPQQLQEIRLWLH